MPRVVTHDSGHRAQRRAALRAAAHWVHLRQVRLAAATNVVFFFLLIISVSALGYYPALEQRWVLRWNELAENMLIQSHINVIRVVCVRKQKIPGPYAVQMIKKALCTTYIWNNYRPSGMISRRMSGCQTVKGGGWNKLELMFRFYANVCGCCIDGAGAWRSAYSRGARARWGWWRASQRTTACLWPLSSLKLRSATASTARDTSWVRRGGSHTSTQHPTYL